MGASVRAALLLAAIGCNHAGSRPAQPSFAAEVCARVPAEQATAAVIYGVVFEPSGRPIGGARIEAVRADREEAWWQSLESFQTTTAANGSYALPLPPGPYLARVIAGAHELLWVDLIARAQATHRLDAKIDRALPAGVTDVIEIGRERVAIAPDCEWTCPDEQAPPPGWWRGALACPAGTRLTYERALNRAAIEVMCQTPDGVRHGPYAAWGTNKGSAAAQYGWYQRGTRCGAWRAGGAASERAGDAPPASRRP